MGQDILLLAEHANGKVKKYSFELASVAKLIADKTGGKVHAVLLGSGVTAGAAELGKYGVATVHVVDSAEVANYNAEVWVNALAAAVKAVSPAVVLGTASPAGRDTLPRVAARLGVAYANDCVDVKFEGKLVAKRPLYSGKCYTQVTFAGAQAMITCRPNTFAVPAPGTAAAEVAALGGTFAASHYKVKEVIKGESDRPDLTEAEVIISGGRAMKEAGNFKILWELADVIGPQATVGASRAAVDSGYAPHAMQVGQTGKTVSPKLYMAFGISGAIQHLAGMRTSKVIVAINKDPDAPIFTKADYGIVGDLFQVVPALKTELKKLLSE